MNQQRVTAKSNNAFSEYPDVVGIDEMVEMLGNISKKAAYKLIRDGDIKAFKIGKSYKVPKQHIISYLKI